MERLCACVVQLARILDADPLLCEFGYVDALDEGTAQGRCADAFVHDAHEHTLAVRAAWLPHVMGAAATALTATRHNNSASSGKEALDCASRAVALLCGECITAWNARRTLAPALDPARELALCGLALSRQPKCGPTWQYRAWLLARHPRLLAAPADLAREHALVDAAAVRYPRNYAAWTHRLWLLARARAVLAPADAALVWHREHAQSTEHCRRHVSDASAFHYRRVLLACAPPRAVSARAACCEACWALALARVYPGHECLWTHCAFAIAAYRDANHREREEHEHEEEQDEEDEDEDEDDERAEEFLCALDETLPLMEAVDALVDAQHPAPATLVRVVALIAADTTSAAYAAQAHHAHHTLAVLSESECATATACATD